MRLSLPRAACLSESCGHGGSEGRAAAREGTGDAGRGAFGCAW